MLQMQPTKVITPKQFKTNPVGAVVGAVVGLGQNPLRHEPKHNRCRLYRYELCLAEHVIFSFDDEDEVGDDEIQKVNAIIVFRIVVLLL